MAAHFRRAGLCMVDDTRGLAFFFEAAGGDAGRWTIGSAPKLRALAPGLGPADVVGAVVRQEVFLPRVDTLFLEVAGQQRVGRLRSVTIAGGHEALAAFRDAVEAWREA
jgi:hypothetical protein